MPTTSRSYLLPSVLPSSLRPFPLHILSQSSLAPCPLWARASNLQGHCLRCLNRWTAKGVLYLSNFRMVFVALKEDESGASGCCSASSKTCPADLFSPLVANVLPLSPLPAAVDRPATVRATLPCAVQSAAADARATNFGAGLRAFDIPLGYIRKEDFKQPIFGCNHLYGIVWPVGQGMGPGGSAPPHEYKLFFKVVPSPIKTAKACVVSRFCFHLAPIKCHIVSSIADD